jgi:hypothetical protein
VCLLAHDVVVEHLLLRTAQLELLVYYELPTCAVKLLSELCNSIHVFIVLDIGLTYELASEWSLGRLIEAVLSWHKFPVNCQVVLVTLEGLPRCCKDLSIRRPLHISRF